MTSHAATRTSIKDIPELKVELWENPKTGDVCAFAWVKTTDLSKRLIRRIAANNAKEETEMESIGAMLKRGEKMQAKNSLPNVQTLIRHRKRPAYHAENRCKRDYLFCLCGYKDQYRQRFHGVAYL